MSRLRSDDSKAPRDHRPAGIQERRHVPGLDRAVNTNGPSSPKRPRQAGWETGAPGRNAGEQFGRAVGGRRRALATLTKDQP